jgi:hypothetical protein
VVQVQEDLQTLLDDLMAPPALHVHDEADTAGVVLVAAVVQAALLGLFAGVDPHGVAA